MLPMTTNDQATADPRAEYIAGLRMLADLLERHSEVPLPSTGRTMPIDIWVTREEDQAAKLAELARLLPGRKTKSQVGSQGQWFCLTAHLRGLKVEVTADRNEVCEKVVTGSREVIEEVPDPELLAAVPVIKRTKVVEEFEYRCRPLLADEHAAVSA